MMTEELARDVMDNFTRIAENEGRVFESGYEQGEEEGYNNGFDDGYVDGYAWGTEEGFVEGKKQGAKEEYDRFWDTIQPAGDGDAHYAATFGIAWKAEIFKPKYDLVPNNAAYMFAFNRMTDDLVALMDSVGKKLDFSNCSNINNAFQGSQFTRLGKIYCKGASSWYNTFASCSKLVTIDEWGHPNEDGTIAGGLTGTFTDCTSLANITVRGIITGTANFQWCPLTKASITSIVNALSPSVSGKTLTLSKTAVNNAFEGGKDGSEWNTLIADKTNWSFSLI